VPTALPHALTSGMENWLARRESTLLTLNLICVVLLFLGFLLTATFKVLPYFSPVVQLGSLVLVGLILLSLISKGLVPVIVCILGVVIIYDAVNLPLYFPFQRGESEGAEQVAGLRYFLLGAGMIAFSTILAYRPSMLFTRNRPAAAEDEWSKYPLWREDSILAGNRAEQILPITSIMTEEDRMLRWRYEYILADIYGSMYLVVPDGRVPIRSTRLLRDKESGRLLGKTKFPGYFI
jgi:hypothetical protein